jgi:SAM-dependent methyltransferase
VKRIVQQIEGSKAYGIGYREWRRQRSFIAADIGAPGTFLDLGCANGFLVCCLRKWSRHALIPYGIDIDPAAIEECRRLFPRHHTHFSCANVRDLPEHLAAEFPQRFDYVFWNIPSGWRIDDARDHVERLMPLVGSAGKLLLAVYGRNAPDVSASEWEADGRAVINVFTGLQERGVVFRHVRYNPWGTHHGVGVVDLSQNTR